MAEEPDDIALFALFGVRARLTGMEEGLNVVRRRIDRPENRVEHIEPRLDLVDTH